MPTWRKRDIKPREEDGFTGRKMPRKPCEICYGKGTILHIEKGKITCPQCRGSGKG